MITVCDISENRIRACALRTFVYTGLSPDLLTMAVLLPAPRKPRLC